MSTHVPDDLLSDFSQGEVDEQLAVHIALHLDSCPACATRAASMNPLASAFASIPDPVMPAGLTAAILEQATLPSQEPFTELIIGGALMGVAAALVVLFGDPLGSMLHFGAATKAFSGIADHLLVSLASTNLIVSVITLMLASIWATARTSLPARRLT